MVPLKVNGLGLSHRMRRTPGATSSTWPGARSRVLLKGMSSAMGWGAAALMHECGDLLPGRARSVQAESIRVPLQLDSQEPRRGIAQHGGALGIAQARRFEDVIDRRVGPGKRIVGPHNDLARSHLGRKMPQCFGRE